MSVIRKLITLILFLTFFLSYPVMIVGATLIEIESGENETNFIKIEYNQEDVDCLAQLIYNEARGVPGKMAKAAVVWTVLNRVDHPDYSNKIQEVVKQKDQYAWSADTPIKKEFQELALDVIVRWQLEKEGLEDIGRVLPKEYLFFHQSGKINVFHMNYDKDKRIYWTWDLPDPYSN